MRPSQRVKVKKNSKREKGVKHLIRDTKRRLSRDIPQEAREGLETKLKALEAQLAAQVSVVTRDNRRQIWFNDRTRTKNLIAAAEKEVEALRRRAEGTDVDVPKIQAITPEEALEKFTASVSRLDELRVDLLYVLSQKRATDYIPIRQAVSGLSQEQLMQRDAIRMQLVKGELPTIDEADDDEFFTNDEGEAVFTEETKEDVKDDQSKAFVVKAWTANKGCKKASPSKKSAPAEQWRAGCVKADARSYKQGTVVQFTGKRIVFD